MGQPSSSDAAATERDPPFLSTLTWLAAITVAIDAGLMALYARWMDHPRAAFLCMVALYAWRGTWFGMWLLWATSVTPWRKSGGLLASYLTVLMVAAAATLAIGGLPANSDGELTIVYGLEVAGWLLIARVFGLRVAHTSATNAPPSWQWSLRSLAAVLTVASIIFWIAGIIWRYEPYIPGSRPVVYTAFDRMFLVSSMAVAFGHAMALSLILMTRLGRYTASIVGAVSLVVVVWFDFPREASWIVGEIGMTLVGCVIFRERMEQDGWRTHFELPFWERVPVAARVIPPRPSDRMAA